MNLSRHLPSTLFLLLCLFDCCGLVSLETEPKLATSGAEVDEALDYCTNHQGVVFIGHFVSAGTPDFGPMGMTRYWDADFVIDETLYGVSDKHIKATYLVVVSEGRREQLPAINKTYVVICAKSDGRSFVSKMLSGTSENIALIQAAINNHFGSDNMRPPTARNAMIQTPVSPHDRPVHQQPENAPLNSSPLDARPSLSLPTLAALVGVVGLLSLWLFIRSRKRAGDDS